MSTNTSQYDINISHQQPHHTDNPEFYTPSECNKNRDYAVQYKELYILYGYNNYCSLYPTKYIYGTYYNITDAMNRITTLCAKTGFKTSFGTYYSNDGRMTYFINVVPIGDQCTAV